MKGIILAGGLGKRFRPLSYSIPKQLIPIANKPALHYIFEYFRDANIHDLGLVVGYTEDRIDAFKTACGDGSQWDVSITYIEQDAPRGIAHAVDICKDFVNDEKFIVFLGDNILENGINKFVKEFSNSDAHAHILVTEVDNPEIYGVVHFNENYEIVSIEEKPKDPLSNNIIIGIYLFTPDIFECIDGLQPSARGELEITHAIERLVNKPGKNVLVRNIDGWWNDVGTFEGLLKVNAIVLDELKDYNLGKIERGVNISGKVMIGKDTVIKSNCTIRGPAVIGDNCTIGPNTYIGPYTSIGHNATIIGSEIEASMILNNSYVQCRERIIESIIGENSKIIYNPDTRPRGMKIILGDFSQIVKTD